MYAPKQIGNVKEQLAYIARYIRRPAIALRRIEEYDGEYVTFRYYDKLDQQEKVEKVSVEEFIARIIRHIPDEQFKTIRHYGVYSRRIKKLSKKLVGTWQETTRKWIVKAKRVLSRRNWREKMKDQTGIDPMVCTKCECYYEYKGEVCLKDGQLQIKYAASAEAKAVLERMIRDLTGIQKPQQREEKEETKVNSTKVESTDEPHQLHLFAM